MSLVGTGTIGLDTVETPFGKAEDVLGESRGGKGREGKDGRKGALHGYGLRGVSDGMVKVNRPRQSNAPSYPPLNGASIRSLFCLGGVDYDARAQAPVAAQASASVRGGFERDWIPLAESNKEVAAAAKAAPKDPCQI